MDEQRTLVEEELKILNNQILYLQKMKTILHQHICDKIEEPGIGRDERRQGFFALFLQFKEVKDALTPLLKRRDELNGNSLILILFYLSFLLHHSSLFLHSSLFFH